MSREVKEVQPKTIMRVRDLPWWQLGLAMVLVPTLAAIYSLWGTRSTQGIVMLDYVGAVFVWIVLSVCGYVGLRVGLKRRARAGL